MHTRPRPGCCGRKSLSSALDALLASPTLRERTLRQVTDQIAEGVAEPIRGLEQLIAGWATVSSRGITPGNPIGLQDRLKGDPPAGANYSYRASGDFLLHPLSVMCRLTTSGVAGDRSLTVEFQDGNGVTDVVAGAPVTLAAGLTQRFSWWTGAGHRTWPAGDAVVDALPDQLLFPMDQLVIKLSGGDVADQISEVRVKVEKFRMDELT